MKIHEFQAKELFRRYGIPVPPGRMAATAGEAVMIAEELGAFPVVIKAQVHAGGRGKAGGIEPARSITEVGAIAAKMLGRVLVSGQTGGPGKKIRKILVERAADIDRELYLSLTIDRAGAAIAIMAGATGGIDIEETAASRPDKIVTVTVNPLTGLTPGHALEIAAALNLPEERRPEWLDLLTRLYSLFVECDCTMVEINPLALTREDGLMALDAKVEIDSNALFRHADLAPLRDPEEEHPLEVEASRHGLNYIHLEGTVGSMVNGAGLAMATMDLIKEAGAEPANFLDVGGGAGPEAIEHGFAIMLEHPAIRVILINIFGGILRCDLLAEGVVRAARRTACRLPVVVRMKGTNAEEGEKILATSGLDLITVPDLATMDRKVRELTRDG